MSTQLDTLVDRLAVEQLSTSKGEPAWLTSSRVQGAELADQLAWPKPEKVNITRWNLTAFGQQKAEAALQSIAEVPQALQSGDASAAAGYLVQRNSANVWSQLAAELAEQGVIFTDLETAAREHSTLVESYLFSVVPQTEDKFTAIQSALWNGGVFVYVPKNVEVKLPLQALLFSDDASATFAPRILVVADTNSRVTYVDHVTTAYEGEAAAVTAATIVEVVAKAGAHVRFATVHNLAANVVDLSVRRAIVENDAQIEWIVGDLNDGNVVSDTRTLMRGTGSNADAKVISIGANKQQMSITTGAVHIGRSSESSMVTRAVMKDAATAIINGITKIEKGATKANGEQTEKVLMLSPKSRGDANPILLIDEDDVKAGHAASVGQVNPEQVYYLMSRGVSKRDAERLIINGFLAPVVSEVPIDALQEQLRALIERKLEA